MAARRAERQTQRGIIEGLRCVSIDRQRRLGGERVVGGAAAQAHARTAMWKPASVFAVVALLLALLVMRGTRRADVTLSGGLKPVPVYALQVPVKDLAMRYLGMSKVKQLSRVCQRLRFAFTH